MTSMATDRLAITPTALPPFQATQGYTAQAACDGQDMAAVLTKDHETLTKYFAERHQFLISKVAGRPEGSQALMPKLPEEPLSNSAQMVAQNLSRPDEAPASSNLAVVPSIDKSIQTEGDAGVEGGCLGHDKVATDTQIEANNAAREERMRQERETSKASFDLKKARSGSSKDLVGPGQIARGLKSRFSHILNQKKAEEVDVAHESCWAQFESFVRGPAWEALFAALIVANALVMAADTQYVGLDTGYNIKYPGSTRPASEVWPGARDAFDMLELTFGIIFVVELVVKIVVFRLSFVKAFWNWLDVLIVGGWCLDVLLDVKSVLNPMMLRLFRLVKLMRVAKLFKTFQAFDSLSILMGSMKASVSVLFWSIVVIFVVQLASALLFCQMLSGYIKNIKLHDTDRLEKLEVYQFFGTFTRSFLTMLELSLGQWAPVCRMLREQVNEWYVLAVMVYVLLVSFAAVKVISAVFILETQKVAATDEALLILQKERQTDSLDKNFAGVFKEIDESGDGHVTKEEFGTLLHDHRVLTWLAALDLDVEQCEGLFSLLDNGDGKISFQEFVQGVHRLKGPARSVDMITVSHGQAELARWIQDIMRMLELVCHSQKVDPHGVG